MRAVRWIGLITIGILAAGGCSSDDDNGGDGGSSGSSGDSGSAGASGSAGDDGGAATGGVSGSSGVGGGTGGGGPCVPATCQGKTYLCGNCLDDDGDGKTDMQDLDCLGPCHDSETGFHPCIAGLNNAPCTLDCYFDQDTGSGNDQCYWDHRCDELSKGPDYPPQGSQCAYDPGVTKPPGMPDTCDNLYDAQPSACETFCGPLTPNGCDCFGCCELPAHSGNFVWLGSTSDDSLKCDKSSCSIGNENDPTKCKPCTPVAACLNECKTCEYCLGKTELPPECFGQDAGTGGSAGDGGSCPVPECPAGVQPCDSSGANCLPGCASGYFCNTGCCVPIP